MCFIIIKGWGKINVYFVDEFVLFGVVFVEFVLFCVFCGVGFV